MPITIDGTGSISGLSAGGLPDLSIATADLADAAVTAPKLSGAQSGSAPVYAARAWVNFNGSGTVAIRASGNVSSITDNGVGNYTVNFSTAMPDANCSAVMTAQIGVSSSFGACIESLPTTSNVVIGTRNTNNAAVYDPTSVHVAIFR